MRPRILFVDDDAAILAGLENVLHRDRRRWDLVFALGGAQALVALSEHPYDVLVTDMRMAGIDGHALLREVHARFPRTTCIVLTGSAYESAGPHADEVLMKPCDAKTLRAALDRLFVDR